MFLKCFKTQANGKKRSNIRGNLKPSAGAKWGSKLGQMRVHLGIRVCLRGGKVGVPWDKKTGFERLKALKLKGLGLIPAGNC